MLAWRAVNHALVMLTFGASTGCTRSSGRNASIQRAAAWLLTWSLFACSDESELKTQPDAASDASVGVDSGPLVVSAINADPRTHTFTLLQDGDEAYLDWAPQGGFVIFVGAIVRNLDTPQVEFEVNLRDVETGHVTTGLFGQSILIPAPDEPGALINDYTSVRGVVHLYLCPNYDAYELLGRLHDLEIRATEMGAQESTGTANVKVKPSCIVRDGGISTQCECQCAANYVPGKCAFEEPLDAGADSD